MNEDLDQPWPHPFEPSTASDGAGHIEINPSMLPPIPMTQPPTDLDRLNELEAKDFRQIGFIKLWLSGTLCEIYAVAQKARESHSVVSHHCELRRAIDSICDRSKVDMKMLEEAGKGYNTAQLRELDDLRAQLTASQASERRMRELLKIWNDDLQESAGGRGLAEEIGLTALLTTPVKAEGADGKLKSALKELFALVNGESPRLLDDDCGGDGKLYMEIEELLKEPATPPTEMTGGAAINTQTGESK